MDKKSLLENWEMFRREHDGVSVDRMICDPQLRKEFLDLGEHSGADEGKILWSLLSLRKRKELTQN